MEQLRRILERVRTHLGKLTPSQRLLLASLGVISLMALFLISQYASKRSMVDLMNADDQMETVRFLQTQGIEAEQRDGRIWVPDGSRRVALAAMAEGGRLPEDAAVLFDSLIDKQKWTNSREQNLQLYTIALQNELSRVLSSFRGIKSATVILDVPEAAGIGRAVRQPTASATVFTIDGAGLNQRTVDAIAYTIAGARAGLAVENVRVIDGSNGRQHAASSADEMGSSNYLEHASAVEKSMRGKLQELLSYIPGVIVAVTARVDIAREQTRITAYASPDEGGSVVGLATSDSIESVSESRDSRSAEPGLRSNAAADINRGGSGQTGFTSEKSDTLLENYVGSKITDRVDPKGMPTKLVASINIPESYVVAALAAGAEGEPEPPTPEEIQQRFDEIRKDIEESVQPHLETDGFAGEVRVSLIRGETLPGGTTQRAGFFGGGGDSGMLGLGEGIIDKALLVVLSLVSLGLMVSMVRKAGRDAKMPTAEELVGLPPVLETATDLIGEVDESEAALEGIEVGEDQITQTKQLEQVGEMVRSAPDQAAKLINRWIVSDD
ncbi:MAG: hypothetical protein ACF8SC_11745 [Phycisphaerales bacterium JB037]